MRAMASQKDKIVLSINSLQGAGAERFVLTIGAAFHQLGFDVHVLRFNAKVEFTLDENLTYHLIDYERYRWLPKGKIRYSVIAKKVDNYILKNIGQPTLLLSNLERSDSIFCYSKLPNIIYVIHNTLSLYYKFNETDSDNLKLTLRDRYSKHPCVCVSEGVKEDFVRYFGESIPVTAIHNPIDRDGIQNLAEAFIPEYQNYIIHVGSFKEAKRHDILLKAYAQTDQSLPLLLAGQGKLKSEIEQLIIDLDLSDKVVLLGFCENVFPYIKHARFQILTSNWEGCPLVVAEGLAVGTPIISTDCKSGPKEMLPKKNLMPTDDITLISEKLNQAMKDSQQFSAPFNEALLPIPIAKKYLAFAESCAKQTSMG
ncbi:glycosyltransferase [Psychrobacter faecalis]|mgnify:CR=1 FL=1|jgi:glycosyltransferase involved in cell wall biosynthesis|uniref:Glycosyltransferase n=2 Tax=Psychrobacter faecalis TaxID=180588 RepID=A0ABT9HEV4_9GAMM|nr:MULTISPECIES: glycosyltransferase [Psychrobacter]MDP4544297.1 glycosyltransferase [Psychrobacter faecalis]